MKIKHLITISIILVIAISGLTAVSAGWFDFNLGGTDLTNEDFDDFTMDVPSDLSLNKSTSLNGRDVLEDAVAQNGGTISFEELDENPKYNHPIWEDENSTISIEYIDYKEDKIKDADDAVTQNYANASFMDESNGMRNYNMSDVYSYNDGDTFAVTKENGDKGVVIIIGQDKDLITQMAESIKFK